MNIDLYKDCTLCPRRCHTDRTENKFGVCAMGDKPYVALADLHFWEEPCISGISGSGAVFFSGCNLSCVYCQNKDISHMKCGYEVDLERLCEIYFELKEKGAENINLVTATHFLPHIISSVKRAKENGINLPFVYNTSGYETEESIERLSEVIDIFLPDFKYFRAEDSKRYSHCSDYPEVAFKAIKKMVEKKGRCVFDGDKIKKGVIIRHLLLPGKLIASKMAIKLLYEEFGESVYYSLMSQYTPNGCLENYPEIDRSVFEYEYRSLVRYCEGLGIKNAYIQDLSSAKESFIPSFNSQV